MVNPDINQGVVVGLQGLDLWALGCYAVGFCNHFVGFALGLEGNKELFH